MSNILSAFTYELAANQRIKVAAVGTTIGCQQASADFDLEVGATKSPMKQGMVFRGDYFLDGVSLVNGATAQTVTIYVGDGDIDLPIPGVVEVVDGAFRRVSDGISYQQKTTVIGVASQYAHSSLRNEAGSGFAVVLRGLSVSDISADTTWSLMHFGGTLTGVVAPVNKKPSLSADATTRVYSQSSASVLMSGEFAIYPTKANECFSLPLADPIVLEPGEGIGVLNNNPNRTSYVNFEYYKVAS